ncbi:protein TIPIN homolog [Bradysia coprophila]|uniref:protein TIPIN homolog n=1 Tax=Bradysia coprophila TaxID=38358 RepID=UPI00187D9189|nr:protein TIPIN homolog [Bradysia coprophila]
MDVFGDDIDSILGNDALNKNIGSGAENEDGNNSDTKDEEGTSKPVDPKRRTIRKPQLRLNVERMIGAERGVHTLEKYFQGIKYSGKGHEKEDLDNVLKRMEHWAHRLYPKYNFKDFLATAEQLGKKKQLQTHMNRYRQGMLELTVKPVVEDEPDEMEVVDQPFDDIDELLGQQIEKYKTAPSATKANNTTFDSMRSSVITTPKFMGRRPMEASTPMSPMGCRPLDETPIPIPSQPDTPRPQLTAEQRAMIAENRLKALERLKARREAAAVQTTNETVAPSNDSNNSEPL